VKALVYTAPRVLEIQELPLPRIGPSDALVRVPLGSAARISMGFSGGARSGFLLWSSGMNSAVKLPNWETKSGTLGLVRGLQSILCSPADNADIV